MLFAAPHLATHAYLTRCIAPYLQGREPYTLDIRDDDNRLRIRRRALRLRQQFAWAKNWGEIFFENVALEPGDFIVRVNREDIFCGTSCGNLNPPVT